MIKNILLLVCLFAVVGFATVDPKLQLGANDFTIVCLPDQHVKSSGVAKTNWTAVSTWIKNNAKSSKIKYVLDLGDALQVDYDTTRKYWRDVDTGLKVIEQANIPFAMCMGNHSYDSGSSYLGRTAWDSLVPQTRYTSKSWFHGGFPQDSIYSDLMWNTFRVGSYKYLIITIPYEDLLFKNTTIQWVKSLLASHPGYYTIINTHAWMIADGSQRAPAIQMIDSLEHAGVTNLNMVMCGHDVSGDPTSKRSDTLSTGTLLNQAFVNYQTINNGDGMIRLIVFKPDSNRIYSYSFKTLDQTYRTNDSAQFSWYYTNGNLSTITKAANISQYYTLNPRQDYLTLKLGKNTTNHNVSMKDTRLLGGATSVNSYGSTSTMSVGGATTARFSLIKFNFENFVGYDNSCDSSKMILHINSAITTANRTIRISNMKTTWGVNDTSAGTTHAPGIEYEPTYDSALVRHSAWASGAFSSTDYYAQLDSFVCVNGDAIGVPYTVRTNSYTDTAIIRGRNVGIALHTTSTTGASGTGFYSMESAVDSTKPILKLFLSQKSPSFSYSDMSDRLGDTVYHDAVIVAPFDSLNISPALPTGYVFDSIAGVIYGEPSVSQASTPYIVTGYNAAGTFLDTFNLTISNGSSKAKRRGVFGFSWGGFRF